MGKLLLRQTLPIYYWNNNMLEQGNAKKCIWELNIIRMSIFWKLGTCWWYLRWIKQPINFSYKLSLLDSYLLIAQSKYNWIHMSAYCHLEIKCAQNFLREQNTLSPRLHIVLFSIYCWNFLATDMVPALWHSPPSHYLELGCSFIQAAPQPNYPRTSSSKVFAASSREEWTSLQLIITSTFRLK